MFPAIAVFIMICTAAYSGDFKMPDIKGMPGKPKLVLTCVYDPLIPGLKAIEKDFQKETGIELEVQAMDNGYLEMWLRCHFMSQDPPAVLIADKPELLTQYGTSGYLHKFNDLLSKPNPFSDSKKPWKDYFYLNMLKQSMCIDGNYYWLPFSQMGVAFFYNEDIYKKYNLKPPKTWAEFIDNSKIIAKNKKTNNDPAAFVTSTIEMVDGQPDGVYRTILEILMRPHIPEVNLRHASGWKFDPNDRKSVEDERIDLSEQIVAFEKGIIDPAKAPEWREAMRLMKEWSTTWRKDYSNVTDSTIPYETFARGEAANFMNGTWYLPDLKTLQSVFAEISPDLLFNAGSYMFPEFTSASTEFPIIGKTFQQIMPRGRLVVPVQKKDKWKNEAAIILCQYLTLPRVSQKIWDNSKYYDIPCVLGVKPKPESAALVAGAEEVAYLDTCYPWGYDPKSGADYRELKYLYFSGKISLDEYLKRLSKSHRESLIRVAETSPDQVDHQFIKEQLGRDFP